MPVAPPPSDYATWHRVPVKTPGDWPGHVTTAADGAIWYDDDNTGGLIRVDPVTAVHTEFSLGLGTTRLVGLDGAPDGAIWFSDMVHKQVGRLDPGTGVVDTYTVSGPSAWVPSEIAFDAAGDAWFGGTNGVAGLTVIRPDGSSDVYADPIGRDPLAITVSPDGRIWFAEDGTPEVMVFDPASEIFSSFPLGGIGATEVGDVEFSGTGELWVVTDRGISSFTTTGTVLSTTIFPAHPFLTRPTSLVAGEFAKMYFADGDGGIGRVNLDDSLTVLHSPFSDGGTRSLTVDGSGFLWFTLNSSNLGWV